MPRRTSLLVALLLAAGALAAPLATPLAAQAPDDSTVARNPRVHAGIAGEFGLPTGAFHRQVSGAGGVLGHLRIRLDEDGLVAMRFQAGYAGYGYETQKSCVGTTPGCRVAVTVSTSNAIVSAALGPEFSLPIGSVRAYAHGLIGVSRFTTFSALDGGFPFEMFAADENQGDSGFSWSTGAGIEVPLHGRFALDMGVAFQGHGTRDYLIKGGITDNPDGSLALDVKRSNANLLAFRVGVTTALPLRRKCGCNGDPK